MARIVVTGGSGFVGSHLCDAFLARGDEVVAVDNLSTGRLQNLAHLAEHPAFSVRARRREQRAPGRGAGRRCAALREPGEPARVPRHPARDARRQLARHAPRPSISRSRNDARFLLASTSEIYGDPDVHPQVESYNGNVDPNAPRAVYDEAKRFAETLAATYRRLYDLPTGIVRIFNTYGPRLRPADGRVVSNFLMQAIDGKPLTMYGTGTPDPIVLLRRRRGPRDHRAVRLRRLRSGEHRQSRTRSRCSSWSTSCARSPVRAPRSCSSRCRSATRRAAAPTSRGRVRCSAGSRRSRCATVSRACATGTWRSEAMAAVVT